MKRQKILTLFFTFQFIFWTFCLNGQNFVTDSKEEIREYFDSLQVKYSIDPAGHGLEWLHFKDGQLMFHIISMKIPILFTQCYFQKLD
jgi:hypothetical protein